MLTKSIFMRQPILLLVFVITTAVTFGQNIPSEYFALVKKADSLYNAKDYKHSAFTYSEAFKANRWQVLPNDRYNAACSWALADYPDSAFFQPDRIATESNDTSYGHMTSARDLSSLRNDRRWKPLLEIIKHNKDKMEANLNKPLIAHLDSIYTEDQKYREQIDEIEKQYGWDSKEMKVQWRIINEKDSINLIKVKEIIDKYGWLGAEVVGER